MKKTILLFTFIILNSCNKKAEEISEIDVNVPVKVTTIDSSGIESYVDLNATATYLVKNIIKANATGYLNSVEVQSNDYVSKGKVLFTLKTREAKVLGNTINKIDPNLKFGDAIKVKTATNGFITNVNAQAGDYVQDGDQLAMINDANSFALVLSLPFELKNQVVIGKEFSVLLPDGSSRKAKVQKFMPSVDAASQAQNVILKIEGNQDIPENLVVKVRINKNSNQKTISLPKEAILSDETETNFWIMKLINNTTAIKIPIEKGIETEHQVEILSPILTHQDKILISGNYGVADTIKVKVIKN